MSDLEFKGNKISGQMDQVSSNAQNSTEIEARVKAIVAKQLGKDEHSITLEQSFIDDLGADSLDLVELVMAFEEEFGTNIPDNEVENIVKVSDAVNYLVKHAKS